MRGFALVAQACYPEVAVTLPQQDKVSAVLGHTVLCHAVHLSCRSTWLKHIIDFDQCISHHKILAIVGASAGCAHAVCISVAYYSKWPILASSATGTTLQQILRYWCGICDRTDM